MMTGSRRPRRMLESSSQQVTGLLGQAAEGDRAAAEALFPVVYEQLRALAGSYFKAQPADHTLQPTALVHEAYLKMFNQTQVGARDRAHFFALAARIMRQILVDHARSSRSVKRGGGLDRISLDQAVTPMPAASLDLIALDNALQKLAAKDENKSRLVELRFFGGLTSEEAADALNISRTQAAREWRFARAWLIDELGGADGP
jgi:RNA polymerase sigma-70 factor, ECF subfamily